MWPKATARGRVREGDVPLEREAETTSILQSECMNGKLKRGPLQQ